jgi:hypothetical protein
MPHVGLPGPCLFRRDLSFTPDGVKWRLPLYWRWSTFAFTWSGITWIPAGRYISEEIVVDAATGNLSWRFNITSGSQAGNWLIWRLPFLTNLDERVIQVEYFRPAGLYWHIDPIFPQRTNSGVGATGIIVFDASPNPFVPNRPFTCTYGLWADVPGTYSP